MTDLDVDAPDRSASGNAHRTERAHGRAEHEDAAATQLYDELMARAWAMFTVLASPHDDVREPLVQRRLAATATRYVSDLARTPRINQALRALLWPTSCGPSPQDAWWDTPLGTLMGRPFDAGS